LLLWRDVTEWSIWCCGVQDPSWDYCRDYHQVNSWERNLAHLTSPTMSLPWVVCQIRVRLLNWNWAISWLLISWPSLLLSFPPALYFRCLIMRSSVNSMVIKLPLLLLLPQPSLPSNMVLQEIIATVSLSTLTVDWILFLLSPYYWLVQRVGLTFYSSYSTALVFDAASQLYPLLKGMSPLSSFAAPYAVSVLRAGDVQKRHTCLPTYKKKSTWKQFALHTAIESGIVALVLYIGSIIEWQFIQQQRLKQHLRR